VVNSKSWYPVVAIFSSSWYSLLAVVGGEIEPPESGECDERVPVDDLQPAAPLHATPLVPVLR